MAVAGLDLNRISVFVHVAEARGVTAAATRLKMPKSSVSRSLSQLESDLGVELVARGNGGFGLTDAGRDLYAAAAAGLAALDAAREKLQRTSGTPHGLVRVAAPPIFAAWLVTPVVARFVQEHPAVEVELHTSGRAAQLRDGFDLVVAMDKLSDSSARVRSLPAVESGLFASAAYLEARGAPRRPSDLSSHDVIQIGPLERRARWSLTGPGGTLAVPVDGRLRVDDVGTAAAAAQAGSGIVALPKHFQSTDASARTLVRVLPDWTARGPRAQLVYRAARHEPLAVRLLREAIVAATSACP